MPNTLDIDSVDLATLLRDGIMVGADGKLMPRPPRQERPTGQAPEGRPRSPVPEWLLAQQADAKGDDRPGSPDAPPPSREAEKWMEGDHGWTGPVVNIGAALTGLPSIRSGIEKLKDDDSDPWHKAAGAGEVFIGTMPGASFVRPLAPAVGALTRTLPRFAATFGVPGALRIKDEQKAELASRAEAAEAAEAGAATPVAAREEEKPFDEPKPEDTVAPLRKLMAEKQRELELAIQAKKDSTPEKGLPPNPQNRGKPLSQGGHPRYWEADDNIKRIGAEIKDLTKEIAGAETRYGEATKGWDARRSGALAKQEGLRKDKALDAAEESVGSFTKTWRAAAPWVGAGAGILASWFSPKILQAAGKYIEERGLDKATKLMRINKNMTLHERATRSNEFASKGGADEQQLPFFQDHDAKSPPFWKTNPNPKEVNQLFPKPKRIGEQVSNAILGTGFYGGEAYFAHDWLQDARKERDAAYAELKKNPTNKTNVAKYQEAKTDVANYEALFRFGQIGVPSHLIKGGVTTAMRPYNQPSTTKHGTERGALAEIIAKQSRQRELREAAEAQQKAQAAASAPKKPRAPRKPKGGGGAAPLLPLATTPLLPGEGPDREPTQDGRTAQQAPHWERQTRSADGRFGTFQEDSPPARGGKGGNITTGALKSGEDDLASYLRAGGAF